MITAGLFMCEDCGYVASQDTECPICGGRLAYADRCDCGRLKLTDDDACVLCRDDADEKLHDFLRSLNASQIEYLDKIVEGCSLEEIINE